MPLKRRPDLIARFDRERCACTLSCTALCTMSEQAIGAHIYNAGRLQKRNWLCQPSWIQSKRKHLCSRASYTVRTCSFGVHARQMPITSAADARVVTALQQRAQQSGGIAMARASTAEAKVGDIRESIFGVISCSALPARSASSSMQTILLPALKSFRAAGQASSTLQTPDARASGWT